MVGRAILQAAVAAGLLWALPGCAGALGLDARDKLTQAQAGSHVYHRSAPEVAAAVRAELEARGFDLDLESDEKLIRTQWIWPLEDDQFVSHGERYVVLVKRLTAHHCRVEALKLTMATGGLETYHPMGPVAGGARGGASSTAVMGKGLSPLPIGMPTYARDFQFEWAVLRRAAPTDAQRIEDTVRTELAHR